MFRWIALAAVVATVGISAVYRHRARRTGEVLARRREGGRMMLLRAACAVPLYAAVLLVLAWPWSMEWAAFALPDGVRWLGAALALAAVPAAWWVFHHLGRNVSETVLTRSDHALVTTGPYRWVRHPLYTTASMLLLGVGLMAANWFILLGTAVAVTMIRTLVIPPEEAALVARFGDAYRLYARRTGRLLPAVGRRG